MSKFIDIKKESTIIFFSRMLDAVAGFVGLLIFTRFLDISGLGVYFILSSVVYTISNPMNGLGVSVAKRMSESNTPSMQYFTTGIALSFVYTIITPLVAYAGYVVVIQRLELFELRFTIFLTAMFFFTMQSTLFVVRGSYEGLGNPGITQFTGTIRGIIETLIQVTLVLYGLTLEGLFIGSAVSALLVTVGIYQFSSLKPEYPSRSSVRHLLSFSKWSILSSSMQAIQRNLDTILVGTLISSAVAGYYGSAKRLVQPASFAVTAASNTLFLHASNETSKNNDVSSELKTARKYCTVIAVPILFGAVVFPQKILSLTFQPEYAAGGYVLVAAAVWKIVLARNNINGSFLAGSDEPKLNSLHTAIRLVTGLISYPIMIYVFDEFGIALALVFTQIPAYIFIRSINNSMTNITWTLEDSILVQIVAGGLMAVILQLLQSQIEVQTLPILAVVVLSGGVIYTIALLALDASLRSLAKSYMSRFIP